MDMYKLHCFAQSGHSYKVALMFALTGTAWEPVFVDFFRGESRSETYRDLNEMGEAPILTHGALRLTQSGVILDYLAKTLGAFGSRTEEEAREIWRWILFDNHKLSSGLGMARFMTLFLPEEKRNADVNGFLMGRAKAALKTLDARLEGRDFVATDRLSIADLSCAGYIWFLDELGMDTPPHVARWRDRIAAMPGWAHPYALMPGAPDGWQG